MNYKLIKEMNTVYRDSAWVQMNLDAIDEIIKKAFKEERPLTHSEERDVNDFLKVVCMAVGEMNNAMKTYSEERR